MSEYVKIKRRLYDELVETKAKYSFGFGLARQIIDEVKDDER